MSAGGNVANGPESGRRNLLTLLLWLHRRTTDAIEDVSQTKDEDLLRLAAAVFDRNPWHESLDDQEHFDVLIRGLFSSPGGRPTVAALHAYLDAKLAGIVEDEVSDPDAL